MEGVAGYVCVFGQPGTEHADEKLTAFVEHLDGFKLAEIDFNLRGPGDRGALGQLSSPGLVPTRQFSPRYQVPLGIRRRRSRRRGSEQT